MSHLTQPFSIAGIFTKPPLPVRREVYLLSAGSRLKKSSFKDKGFPPSPMGTLRFAMGRPTASGFYQICFVTVRLLSVATASPSKYD